MGLRVRRAPDASFAVAAGGGSPIPDRVTLLADVAEVVARSHDLDETLANVVDLVAKRLDADVCSLYLTATDLSLLVLRATVGLRRESVGRVKLRLDEGLVGLAAERQQPVVIEHAREHPRYKYFPETGEEQFETLMAAPLIVRGIAVGVLVVQTREARHFDQGDVDTLQTCAQLIAPVVVNAQLLSIVGQSPEERARYDAQLALSGVPIAQARASRPEKNAELAGIPTARGVAIGPVFRLPDPLDLSRLDYAPSPDAGAEERDLLAALHDARRDLDEMREEMGEQFGPDFAAVFHTHVQILEDKGFVAKLRSELQATGNALEALRNVLAAYRATFERIADPYFRDRAVDVEDVGRRVMERLLGVRHHLAPMPEGAIVVADHILPGYFARLDLHKVAAFVAEHGGATSHGAIFARTLEIPAVTGVAKVRELARDGETAIVDGGDGTVMLSPDEALIGEYRRAQRRYAVAIQHLDAMRDRPGQTRDGRRIALTANVGLASDLRLVEQHGAEGVGLFRTELLALVHRGHPEEEEQEQLYERVARALAPRPVTIRTLDLGGDKDLASMGIGSEENPQLGCRSIRLSFENEGVFRAQLRAILRASALGNVRLLLPMISSLSELRRARALVEDVKREMRESGAAFDERMPLGVMIEVPSAALTADAIARECDFLSIGTNDLTQYTLAVDRTNEHVAHLYDPLHPAVLALIDRSARAAARAGIPVSLCGEMVSDPLAVPLLVGLGISELSGAPSVLPVVKEILHALEAPDVEADARAAREVGTAEEVRAIAAARLCAAGLLEHPDIGPWLRPIVGAAERAVLEPPLPDPDHRVPDPDQLERPPRSPLGR
jgi:phosphotransferase system enzyme I (PtsP)